jgi:hypothetical protein
MKEFIYQITDAPRYSVGDAYIRALTAKTQIKSNALQLATMMLVAPLFY